MSGINFLRTYQLGPAYEHIKQRAMHKLAKYGDDSNPIDFNDLERSLTFTTERLVPTASTNRPRVMLLFSNPHPLSIHQGMFLSPNTRGRESLFWPVMEDAGWLSLEEKHRSPKQLADICIKAGYRGPFELIFYCYYAFPTDYPEDIRWIFGREYFSQSIAPHAAGEFRQTIRETPVKAVVTFNKGIFNLVSEDHIERYIERLKAGELIQSQIKGIDRPVSIFLTYPTGYRYHKQYRQLRKASLEQIKRAILGGQEPQR